MTLPRCPGLLLIFPSVSAVERWRAGSPYPGQLVLIWSLMLSDTWTSLRPNFLAAQDIVLWHEVLGEEVVNDVLILPMVFAIVLPEYVAWLFLYIC